MPSSHLILCHPLSSCLQSFPALGSLHQVAKVLGLRLKHQSFQWIFRVDFLQDWLVWSPCCPRDSEESFPTPQFKSINSLALSLLYGPTLTSIHDYWKNTALTIRTAVGIVASLFFNMLSSFVMAFLPKSKRLLIFMAIVTVHSDFGAQENKVCHCSIFPPSICCEVMGPDAMILVFWMLSFKLAFSLSSFTFIKRLFSSSSLSAIKVVSSAYMRLLVFLLAILISTSASSSCPVFPFEPIHLSDPGLRDAHSGWFHLKASLLQTGSAVFHQEKQVTQSYPSPRDSLPWLELHVKMRRLDWMVAWRALREWNSGAAWPDDVVQRRLWRAAAVGFSPAVVKANGSRAVLKFTVHNGIPRVQKHLSNHRTWVFWAFLFCSSLELWVCVVCSLKKELKKQFCWLP